MATITVTVKTPGGDENVELEQEIFQGLDAEDVVIVNDHRYGVARKGLKVYNKTIGGEIPPTQYFIETK